MRARCLNGFLCLRKICGDVEGGNNRSRSVSCSSSSTPHTHTHITSNQPSREREKGVNEGFFLFNLSYHLSIHPYTIMFTGMKSPQKAPFAWGQMLWGHACARSAYARPAVVSQMLNGPLSSHTNNASFHLHFA